MTAWGPGSFENDAAVDWALECARTADFLLVEAALDNVLAAEADEIDAADAEEAIAAAEVVARASVQRDAHSTPLDDWVERIGQKPGPALLAKAHETIRRIRDEPNELNDLWSDSDGFARWYSSLDSLLTRLG